MIQAIVGLWRNGRIEAAKSKSTKIAKALLNLRARRPTGAGCVYNWGNSVGDPTTSTASPCLAVTAFRWWTAGLIDMIARSGAEGDEEEADLKAEGVDKVTCRKPLGDPVVAVMYKPILHAGMRSLSTPHALGARLLRIWIEAGFVSFHTRDETAAAYGRGHFREMLF